MQRTSSAEADQTSAPADDYAATPEYEPPHIVDVGQVRDVTKGSSRSGTADANSQYYW